MEAEDITKAVEDGIKNQISALRIKDQKHYDDHQKVERLGHDDIDFIIASREFVKSIKDAFWKTLVRALVVVSLSVITGGVYAWFKYKGHH